MSPKIASLLLLPALPFDQEPERERDAQAGVRIMLASLYVNWKVVKMPLDTTRKQAKGPGQRYQLLLQPVLMRGISTG